jgi:hypothetical protein
MITHMLTKIEATPTSAGELSRSGPSHFPPRRFRRPAGLLPLPVPQRGSSIEQFRSLLNDQGFAVAWLWAALRPSGPYPHIGDIR